MAIKKDIREIFKDNLETISWIDSPYVCSHALRTAAEIIFELGDVELCKEVLSEALKRASEILEEEDEEDKYDRVINDINKTINKLKITL